MFSAVNRWIAPIILLISTFASVLAPFVAHSLTYREAVAHMKYGLWLFAVSVCFAVAVFFAAPWIVEVFLGAEYSASVEILRVLAIVAVPSMVSQVILVALQSLGAERYVAVVWLIGVTVQLALVVSLGAIAGGLGAAWAMLVVEVFFAAFFLFRFLRAFRNERPKSR